LPFNPESLHPDPEPAFYIESRGRVDRWCFDRGLRHGARRENWKGLRVEGIAAGECVLVKT
jgi:hypothetical protein